MTKIEVMQSQDSDKAKVDMAFDKLMTYIKEYTQEEIESAIDELKNKYTDNTDKHTPDVRVMKQSPFMPSFMPVQNMMVDSIEHITPITEEKQESEPSSCGLGLDNECDCSKDEYNVINRPSHYCSHGIETIDKIEAVIDGLPAKEAYLLSNILKYFDRAGLKDDAEQDLKKGNAYACRLVYGQWTPKTEDN